MPFSITNRTHWRTVDIRKLLVAAVARGGSTKTMRNVLVTHGTRDTYGVNSNGTEIHIGLRVVGSKRSPLHALAAASYDVPIVDPQSVAQLLNGLALDIMNVDGGPLGNPVVWRELIENARSTVLPPWAPQDLVIRKYADPLKDSTYQKYVKKVESAIASAERRAERYAADLEKAKRGLAKAQRDVKKHQARLRSAKERRGL